MQAERKTVTSSAAAIGSPGSATIAIRNAGDTDCYLGGSGVSSSTGFLLAAGEFMEFAKVSGTLYAVTASGSTTLHTLFGSGA